MFSEHVLVLGATGVSGLIFVDHLQSLPASSRPKLTVYVRSRAKVPNAWESQVGARVVVGELTDAARLADAMAGGVTTVVSFLGAYANLMNFLLRRSGPTPIADAMPTVCDAMRAAGVKRLFALSTAAGFPQPGELAGLSWPRWALIVLLPKVFVPQGHAEMAGIAAAVCRQDDLDWTVYRVPHLNENRDPALEVVPGLLGPGYKGSTELSRLSQAKWILKEIEERKWVKGAPFLSNP